MDYGLVNIVHIYIYIFQDKPRALESDVEVNNSTCAVGKTGMSFV